MLWKITDILSENNINTLHRVYAVDRIETPPKPPSFALPPLSFLLPHHFSVVFSVKDLVHLFEYVFIFYSNSLLSLVPFIFFKTICNIS